MLLFVYGSLRRGYDGQMSRRLAAESEWLGRARLEGAQLYRVKWTFDFPAFVQPSSGKNDRNQEKGPFVVGDLYRLLNPEATLEWLHKYETDGSAFSERDEFVRREVRVRPIDNCDAEVAEYSAAAYLWDRPIVDPEGEPVPPVLGQIASGDWLSEWREEKESGDGKSQ